MTLQEFAKSIEARVMKAVQDEARLVVDEIRQEIPANRVKTRRAIKAWKTETGAKVGLRFARQYPTRNTPTHQFLEQQWRKRKPTVRQRLIARLNQAIHGE